jgi:hypothetical protein
MGLNRDSHYIPCDILAIGYFHIGVPSSVFML